MASPAKLISIPEETLPDDFYMGPAQVLRPDGRYLHVQLDGGREVSAELALALPYVAAEGDVVLVMGRGERHYVVGVLHGSGKTSLRFRGDVDLVAVGGRVNIQGDQGVHLRGDEVALEGREVKMVGESLIQRFNAVAQRVRGLFSSRMKRAHLVVDETAFSKSKNATVLSDESVTINGEQIHLG